MSKTKEVKTNAMRILESLKIPYTHHTYECEEFVDGLQIADKLSLPYEQVYKTLVTVSNSKNYFVFVIPIAAELDLKKAAKYKSGFTLRCRDASFRQRLFKRTFICQSQ